MRISLLSAAAITFSTCTPQVAQQAYYPDETVSLQVFYTQLSPYGRWMDYQPYGYVWIPNVSVGFSPYLTNGYWVYTRYGWTWHSSYPWGWAPFHYGRWSYDHNYGWLWLPDTTWGPGWVAWRAGGGYCGWAPLGIGVSVEIVLMGGHSIPHEHWIFVHDRDLYRRDIHRHRVERSRNPALVENVALSQQIRGDESSIYMHGPDREEIQATTGRRVNEVEVRERTSPGQTRLEKGRMEIYKPEVRRNNEREPKPVPERVYERDEIKRPAEKADRERTEMNRQRPVTQPRRQSNPQPTPPPPVIRDNDGKDNNRRPSESRGRTRYN